MLVTHSGCSKFKFTSPYLRAQYTSVRFELFGVYNYWCMLRIDVLNMAPYSSTFAWKIPWTEEPGGLQSMRSLESDMTEWLHFHFSRSHIGEGSGSPLQCSCLENPRDGEAWWAAVSGVAQSWTRLKWLSSSSSSIVMLDSRCVKMHSFTCQFINAFRSP